MVSIKLVNTITGRPIQGYKVSIGFSGFTRGFSSTLYSDKNGEVHFDNDPGNGTIYVNGNNIFNGRVEGMKIIYL